MSSNLLQLNRSGSLFLLDNSAEVDVCGTIISDVLANDSGQFLEGDLAASSVGLAIVNSPASDNLVSGQANAGRGGRHIDPPQLSGNCNISKQGGSRATVLVEMSVDSLQLNRSGSLLLLCNSIEVDVAAAILGVDVGASQLSQQAINRNLLRRSMSIALIVFPDELFIFAQSKVHQRRIGRQSGPVSNSLICKDRGTAIFIIIMNDSLGQLRIFCKRCKRHAHDEHESGSQQSQQTSFEVRFLHVNFSYSLKFI